MKENTWKKYTKEDEIKLEKLCDGYKEFLTVGKTERECVTEIIAQAEQNGFKDLNECINNNTKLNAGDKVYVNNRNKAVALFVIVKKDIIEGMNILGAHIDSPRLDLKANA